MVEVLQVEYYKSSRTTKYSTDTTTELRVEALK